MSVIDPTAFVVLVVSTVLAVGGLLGAGAAYGVTLLRERRDRGDGR